MRVTCSKINATPSARVAKQSASSPVMVIAAMSKSGHWQMRGASVEARFSHSRHMANGCEQDHPSACASLRLAPPMSMPKHRLVDLGGMVAGAVVAAIDLVFLPVLRLLDLGIGEFCSEQVRWVTNPRIGNLAVLDSLGVSDCIV